MNDYIVFALLPGSFGHPLPSQQPGMMLTCTCHCFNFGKNSNCTTIKLVCTIPNATFPVNFMTSNKMDY